MDSTGAASVKRDLKDKSVEIVVAKELGHPFNLLGISRKNNETDFDDVLKGQHRALIGHTRSSTKGAVSRQNAHPFKFDTLVGTHNGTLSYQTHHQLKHYQAFDTDSQALYAEIADNGIEVVVKSLDDTTGGDAYALVWFDGKSNTINFLRNKQRPLFYAFADDKKMLWWSSEPGHLVAALPDIPHPDKEWLFELPEGMHFSWEIPEAGKSFGKARVVKREGKKVYVPFASGVQQGSHLFKHDTHWDAKSGSYVPNNSGGKNSPSNTDGTGNKTPMVYSGGSHGSWDGVNFCYSKYSMTLYTQLWSWHIDGPWYESQQNLWQALSFEEQVQKQYNYKIPGAVTISQAVRMEVARRRLKDKEDNGIMAIQTPTPRTDLVEGNESLASAEVVLSTTPEVKEKIVPIQDQIKEKKFRIIAGDLETDKKVLKVYSDPNRKVYWNRDTACYTVMEFQGLSQDPPWTQLNVKTCPVYVPYTKLHDHAHEYVYKGARENKIQFRLGYKRDMLTKQRFEFLMSSGCMNCQRVPEWSDAGVQFINHEDYFCEACSRDEESVKLIKQIAN